MHFAAKLVENAPLTISGSKQMLDAIADGSSEASRDEIDRLIAGAYQSQDYKEGRAPFAQKRRAKFRGN